MSVNQDIPLGDSHATSEYVIRGAASFGTAVREFRVRAGVNQAELARMAELHRSYLSSLEGGTTTEAVRAIMRLLGALDLEVIVRPRRRGTTGG